MSSILSLFAVLTLSLLIHRTATVALTLTGLSRESARFQARSAFTGAGFTTSESEAVVNHPVRRRILMLLMLFGNIGVVSVVASGVLAFDGLGDGRDWTMDLLVLGSSLAAVAVLATSHTVERVLAGWIERALARWTTLEVSDYARLLHLCGEYSVVEIPIEAGKWLTNRTLGELSLDEEGVLVLGVQRAGGRYDGVPVATTLLAEGDTLIAYGRVGRLAKLDRRGRGPEAEECRSSGLREQLSAVARTTNETDGAGPITARGIER